MLKKASYRRIIIASLSLLILLIIYFFPSKISYKEKITYIENPKIPIYLLNKNNYIIRTNIASTTNDNENLIREIIEILTIGSIKSSYMPNDFIPIIPKNTKLLNFEIKNNILFLDFNDKLLDIEKEKETKLLESLTYSLTEIKGINKISIKINNKDINKFKSGTIIPKYLDKSIGINKKYNIKSIKNTNKTTIYYMSKTKENLMYYIPITKITNDDEEKIEIIIKELKSNPIHETNLISYLATSSNLTNYELLENKMILSFNNLLIANLKNKDILEEVKYSIALSVRDTYNVNEIIFDIQNKKEKFSI